MLIMANFQAFPPAGPALPKDWQAQASAANAAFMANYQAKMDAAWRKPLTSTNSSLAQAARLTNQEPPAPPRRDARSDTRMDGTMRLVLENEMMELWRNDDGTTVQIMKKRK